MRAARTPLMCAMVLSVLSARTSLVEAGSVCGRAKLQAVGKLADCRAAAWSKADRRGISPAADLSRCDAKFTDRWTILDGQPTCLTTGDATTVRDDIATCVDAVAERLVVRPKVIFTTAALLHGGPGPTDANFQYVSGADAHCQAAADAVPALQGKGWVAWLSGPDPDTLGPVRSAAERTTHSPGPYVRADGVLLAVNFAGLISGTLLAPLEKDEYGNALPDGWGAWTGTEPDGSAAPASERCDGWNNNGIGVAGWIGKPSQVDSNWTKSSLEDCHWGFHLYCIEQ